MSSLRMLSDPPTCMIGLADEPKAELQNTPIGMAAAPMALQLDGHLRIG